MNDLEGVSTHIHDKISSLQHLLDLSDLPQNKLKKLGQEVCALGRLLEELEKCVGQRKEQLNQLKDLEGTFQRYLEDIQHMSEHTPAHMPWSKPSPNGGEPAAHSSEAEELRPSEGDRGKQSDRTFVREMAFLTVPEFKCIPQYMKGRITYDQLNAAVQNINTAVKAKYRILQQPLKGLNNHSRKLHARFKEQETKATKGQYFVVEDDIRELAQVKVDKRFQGILNMLRHCQRLRELRGGGITRYTLL